MRKLAFALALTMLGSAALGEPKEYSAWLPTHNGETQSCATALGLDNKLSEGLKGWVLGYFTGMNENGAARVGGGIDANGIVGEVEKRCREEPSTAFGDAVWQTYNELRKLGH